MTDQSGPRLELIPAEDGKSMRFAISNDGVLRAGITMSDPVAAQSGAWMAVIPAERHAA